MKNSLPQTIRLADYRVPEFLIEKVDLHIELGEAYTTVKSQLAVIANHESRNTSNTLVLDGENMELISVAVDGKSLEPEGYKVDPHSLTIYKVPVNKLFNVEIETRIKPQENTALTGLYKSSGNFCTQCEAHGFRRITYFLDRPDVMAKYTTTIVADEEAYPVLLSNGNLVDSGKSARGKHWVRWEDPFKKPSYLFALVAGDLEFIEDEYQTLTNRKVTLKIFVEKGNLDKCTHAMQAVKKAMRWDEENYGREYDLNVYMLVAVSDFNMGAMENKGLNIFNTKYILAKADTATDEDFIHVESVIAHEYFHNWTGNRITCRDWFQLSLKEGLTIFRDQSFTADTTSKAVARIHDVNLLRIAQFSEDASPLAHPVRPDSYIEINNFYTTTVYNKGAEVIRMMQTLIGKKAFRAGMDLYFSRHDGEAVTIEDFAKAIEDGSGMDLTQFRLWYSQAGTPIIEAKDSYDAEKQTYTLTLKQSCPATPGQPDKKPFHIPVVIGLFDKSGKEIVIPNSLLQLKKTEETFTFENITSKPIPSLLRHFSAPVKINYNYTDEDLQILFKYDTDAFNRWEAGQKLALNNLFKLIKMYQEGQPLTLTNEFLAAFHHVLQSSHDDKSILAEMLILPAERYIGEQMTVIDVDAIHTAREFMLYEIANYSKDLFAKLYAENNDPQDATRFTLETVAKRHLKNLCLFYLMLTADENQRLNLGYKQFQSSLNVNMTDTIAALRTLTNIDSPLREKSLNEFYDRWREDALVMDKWLTLQAISKLPATTTEVKNLLTHPAFDIKNPNKVYALIGAYGQNLIHFHARNGEGYNLVAEVVMTLDELNPQIAARMVKPFMSWRQYDEARQRLMRVQLEKILNKKHLSKDVYELVSKSLKIDEVIPQ